MEVPLNPRRYKMTAHLITFRPKEETPNRGMPLAELRRLIRMRTANKPVVVKWRFHGYRQASLGDRVFLLLQGKHGPAVIGYGAIAGSPEKTRGQWCIPVSFGVLVDPTIKSLATRGELLALGESEWRTQVSGVSLNPNLANRMEKLVVDRLQEEAAQRDRILNDGPPAYLVMAKAKDESAKQRVIESYDASKVWAVDSLHAMEDGSVWAELGDAVPVAKLSRHSLRHRVRPTPAEFPIAGSTAGGASSRAGRAPAYLAALPAMRAQLIYVARRRATITYAEARAPFNVWSLVHRHAMSRLGHECLNAGEPILTSLIVDPITKRCSAGFESEFHRDDQRERESCYQFWAAGGTLSGKAPALRTRSRRVDELNDFQNRALKFANVAVRPDQAAFRREVFIAFNGACIVTGCSVAAALDAAHRRGRDWKLGHNRAEDGLLLRKDIHALYDAGLVKITDDGKLIFSREVPTHYRQYV